MKRTILLWVFMTALALFLTASPVLAKGEGKERPSGWDKREKKGWQSDVPPGQEKKQYGGEEEERKVKKEKKEKKVKENAKIEKEKKAKEVDKEKTKKEKEVKEKKSKEEIEEGKKKEKKESFWQRWFGKGKKEKVE